MASINPFLPIQEGTGDPSPENIRPIKPAVSIAGGKNLCDEEFLSKLENYPIQGVYDYKYTEPIFLKPNTTYKFSFTNLPRYETIRYWAVKIYNDKYENYDDLGDVLYIINSTYSTSPKITTGARGVIRFAVHGGQNTLDEIWDRTNVQLEEGSTSTEYEPYQSLDIYGGYLDIVNSKIVEEWEFASGLWGDIKTPRISSETNLQTSSIIIKNPIVILRNASDYGTKTLSNIVNTVLWQDIDVSPAHYYGGSTGLNVYLMLSRYLNDTQEIQIVAKLQEPITHYLSPIQLVQAMEQLGIKLSSTLIDVRRKILLNSPHLETTSDLIASFKTDMKAPLKECKIHFLPMQSGSGDPSPTNIRPITGWTGVNAEHSGENLFPSVNPAKTATYSGITIYNNGNNIKISGETSGSLYRGVSSSWVADGEKVYIYGVPDLTGTGAYWYVYDGSNVIVGENINGSSFVTRNGRETMLAIGIDPGGMSSTIDIDFTPVLCKQPSTQIPISFGDNGTIYGGYIDLVSGELTAEWSSVLGSSLGWFKGSAYPYFATNSLKNSAISSIAWPEVSIMCESYRTISFRNNSDEFFDDVSNYTVWQHGNLTGDVKQIRVKDTRYETLEDFNAAIANVRFVYKLETPITYQLTPQQLKSLKGINNIWSDTNDAIEVKYWTH